MDQVKGRGFIDKAADDRQLDKGPHQVSRFGITSSLASPAQAPSSTVLHDTEPASIFDKNRTMSMFIAQRYS